MKARIIGTVILLLVLFVVADATGMFDSLVSGSNSSQSVNVPAPAPMSSADSDMKGLKIN